VNRIDAGVLIPGAGAPLAAATVLTDGGTISYAGPTAGLGLGAPARADVHVPVVMPGMWDCHCHLYGVRRFSLEEMLITPVPTAAARSAKDAEAALQAGFTSLREAGGIGIWLAPAVEEGTINGPSIYSAGSVLSQTGGHADVHTLPAGWVAGACEDGRFLHLCDGVPECLRAVRLQLRKNAKVIKVCASGGVTSTIDDPVHQQFSDEELRAIVGDAARAGRAVMAHCHGKPGIMAALRAGVHSIEHGSYLDEEAGEAMREAGAILVPTRSIIARMLTSEDKVPSHAYRKIRALADRHLEAIAIAHAAGVTIAAGTDIGTTGPDSFLPWGTNGTEPALLHQAGLSPLAAIEAVTANGPRTLGPQAPRSGQLRPGFDADLLALSRNPLEDLTVLADPKEITHVWKRGQLVKHPVAL
jgi:imidazolonepropionase-like amidohydrolase